MFFSSIYAQNNMPEPDCCVVRRNGELWAHAVSLACAARYGTEPFRVQQALSGSLRWVWCTSPQTTEEGRTP